MPLLSDSAPLSLPLRATDRLFVERDGRAPYEVSLAAVIDLVAAEIISRTTQVIPAGAILFPRGYLSTDRGPIVFA